MFLSLRYIFSPIPNNEIAMSDFLLPWSLFVCYLWTGRFNCQKSLDITFRAFLNIADAWKSFATTYLNAKLAVIFSFKKTTLTLSVY